MDLGAYANIVTLGNLAKENGIIVPRLRGYRLMSQEEPLTKSEIEEQARETALDNCADILRSMGYGVTEYSSRTDYKVGKYMVLSRDSHHDIIDVNWGAVHGDLRRQMKFEIKKTKKRYFRQYNMFNKYCGREDVLYIHARIGGNNWAYYGGADLQNKEWFLDRVDDAFDSTYCDIYAKINEQGRDG